MKARGPEAANGAIALALVWAGSVALLAIVIILTLGPMFGALGCPGGCSGDPLILRVLRVALTVAAAYGAFVAIVLALLAAARRTRFAAIGLGLVGTSLLAPPVLAVADVLRREAGVGWPAVLFVGVGVPGLGLLYAGWVVARSPSSAPDIEARRGRVER